MCPSKKCPFSWEDADSHLTQGYLGSHKSVPKQHPDRFSRFCTAHKCALDTDIFLLVTHESTKCFHISDYIDAKAHTLNGAF